MPARVLFFSIASLALVGFLGSGCSAGSSGPAPVTGGHFRDATAELGLPTAPAHWPDGTYHVPEAMQGGVGLFDYDGDGRLDVLHVRIPPPGSTPEVIDNRLYRQTESGVFEDVTERAGLTGRGFGQGLAIGDVDGDGDEDVYIANFGPDRLLRNEGDGTFVDVTDAAGIRGNRWTSAASFFDRDGDGDLDLYVVHYMKYDREKRCTDGSARREYCGPRSFAGWADVLYDNDGTGHFTDVSDAAGIVLPGKGERATGLGIACADFTGDGLPDVFVANDAEANQLWVSRGDGTYSEEGILRGVAVNGFGNPEASMGVTAGDVDGDGTLDLFMTHLIKENNRLYLGGRMGLFSDSSVAASLTMNDVDRTGFGCGFFDFDNDGDLDIAVANGAIRQREPMPGAPSGWWGEYAEPNQLFEGDGAGRFVELDRETAGAFVGQVEVSRGLAFGDIDGDGDVDMVASNVDNSLRVYRNEAAAPTNHWLQVRTLDHGHAALGARVVLTAGGRSQTRAVLAASSYLSSNDPRVHFGLGGAASVDSLVVTWTDGTSERFDVPAVDREVTVARGRGARQ